MAGVASPRAIVDVAPPPRIGRTITTFARAADITVAELAIESFSPTDTPTAAALREFAAEGR
jgi:hypothetical protein